MKTYDIAVIGGGIAGLVAANQLAQVGKSVILFEKSPKVGGRGITINKNGALFNLGGHAIFRAGEAYSLFQEWGLKLDGGKPTTHALGIWQGKVVPLGHPAKMLFSSFLSWSAKLELVGLLSKLSKLAPSTISPRLSLREWAEKEIRDPMVRHIFYALARTATYVHDADYQTASPALRQVQSSLKLGVHYVNGGWQTIVDQLRTKAIGAGVDIMESSSVAEIEQAYSSVHRIVLADGRTWSVTQVISTVPPAETYRMLSGAEQTILRQWKAEARPSKAACLDLCLRKLPMEGRNLAIGLDQPVFFSNHSAVAKLSENGTKIVHLIKYNGGGGSDPMQDQRLLEQTMSILHPNWEREVVTKQYLPNIAVVHDYPHLGRTEQHIGPSVSEIAGLYVAGDGVNHGELLLDAAVASATRAVTLAVQQHGRLVELAKTNNKVAL